MGRISYRKILAWIFGLFVLLTVSPVIAGDDTETDEKSVLAPYFDASCINPQYTEWQYTQDSPIAPPMNNMDYLVDSYARMPVPFDMLPSEFDLREYGKVEPVYSQDPYSICWAVAAAGSCSSVIMRQFPQASFSPMHMSYFMYYPDAMDIAGNENPYDVGGFSGFAIATLAAWKGPVFYAKYPIEPGYPSYSADNAQEADFHLQNAYCMMTGSLEESDCFGIAQDTAKRALMNYGALSMAYRSQETAQCFNPETNAFYCPEEKYADHQVLIVGWDDNFPRENFSDTAQPERDGAWLVRNSWGTDWADEGYFWLSYEDATSSLAGCYILDDRSNYANNYQYDGRGWCISLASDDTDENNISSVSNIFTAEDDEILEAVSFYTTEAMASYTVCIYTDVETGSPQSGECALENQCGVEKYAGYHTLTLKEPVALKKGEQFSVVLTLDNDTYPMPIAAEACYKRHGKIPPAMRDSKGSYVLEKGKWEPVQGSIGEIYVSNVCIKAFTNPMPESGEAVGTVAFSQIEGQVAEGSRIFLQAGGKGKIFYRVNDGQYREYEDPIRISFEDGDNVVISAYAEKDGKKGNTTTKVYRHAVSQLSNLAVVSEGDFQYIETDAYSIREERVPYNVENVSIYAESADSIYVNGEKVPSGSLSEPVALVPGQRRTVSIRVKSHGETEGVYDINLRRSAIDIDFEKETAAYDETAYTLKDGRGNTISSGQSITPFIRSDEPAVLELYHKKTGNVDREYLPVRPHLKGVGIDFYMESTINAFAPTYHYSRYPDMHDSTVCDGPIPLVPGEDIYIERMPAQNAFRGEIYRLEVPKRPDVPNIAVCECTDSRIVFDSVENVCYLLGDEWTYSGVFENLLPDTLYMFYTCLPATENSFASLEKPIRVKTQKPPVNPGDYFFDITYIDREGSQLGENRRIYFNREGKYSVTDIPIPEGYELYIPNSVHDEIPFVSELFFRDGEWQVSERKVQITVTKINNADTGDKGMVSILPAVLLLCCILGAWTVRRKKY